MKKILFTGAIASVFLLAACGDSSTKSTEATTSPDTATAAMEAPAAPATVNNIVSKTGIPLKSDEEVPANKSTGSGTADVTYNKDSKMLTYTLTWTGLTGNATMAHIHGTAAKGVNAGVKHDLINVLKKETAGSFTDSVKIDASDIKEDSLLSGFYYFNIHTQKNPGGEIRGQIVLQ